MSGAFNTPPIVAAELAPPPRRVVWPVVIGVIAIVFGALGVLQSLGGLVLPLVLPAMDQMASQMPRGQAPPVNPFAAMHRMMWLFVGAYGVLGASAVGLLVLGIGVVRRSRWGALGMRIWGVWGILAALGLGAVSGYAYATMMTEMMASVPQTGRGGGPPPELGMTMGIIMGVILAALLSILPLFITIWFSIRSVRAEVARWGTAGGGVVTVGSAA